MAKIVLMINDVVLRETELTKERFVIGRRLNNDLVIDSLAVSGEHAAIDLIDNDAILEDLNSTNGTQVNGQPVRKHFLQHNDVIELAQYRIRYIANCPDAEREIKQGTAELTSPYSCSHVVPAVKVLNGPNTGKKTFLNKSLTTIGRPGVQVALITQTQQGYFLSYVEGKGCPLVNGKPIAPRGYQLSSGDVIEIVGTKIEFC